MYNIWLSGGGGGFGSNSHDPNIGGSAGFTWGALDLKYGEQLSMYVGCGGASGDRGDGRSEGGGGGGASAVIKDGKELLVAGGSGAQSGGWDPNRQNAQTSGYNADVMSSEHTGQGMPSTHGGHGGGREGQHGGTSPCNQDCGHSCEILRKAFSSCCVANLQSIRIADGDSEDCNTELGKGGGGGTQSAGGYAGTSNRGYENGAPPRPLTLAPLQSGALRTGDAGNGHKGGDAGGG